MNGYLVLRASSDFVYGGAPLKSTNTNTTSITSSGGLPPPHTRSRNIRSSNKPPLKSVMATPGTYSVLGIPLLPPATKSGRHHRRIKSDLPKGIVSFETGTKLITKSDLLKNFPDPRWGSNNNNVSLSLLRSGNSGGTGGMHRKRSSSGDVLLETSRESSTSNNSVTNHPLYGSVNDMQGRGMMHTHTRMTSDMSLTSAVTDMTKSALVKEVTEGGMVRFQLPKDNFRILMDCSLGTLL